MSVPTAPLGAPGSSAIAFSAGLFVASRTGAVFPGETIMEAVSVADENAVVPPLEDVLASPPFVPLVSSHARNVIAFATVPKNGNVGWK